MKLHLLNKSKRGQSALEYFLILAVIAALAIAGFSKLLPAVYNSQNPQTNPEGFYSKVSRVIVGGEGNNPQPINGGWCPVECPPKGSGSEKGNPTRYRTCECPAPAFGGLYCDQGKADTYPNNTHCIGDHCSCDVTTPP